MTTVQIVIGTPLTPNLWYTVRLEQLRQGSSAFNITINGALLAVNASQFSGLDFGQFDGPLFIGGHPNLSTIRVYTVNFVLQLLDHNNLNTVYLQSKTWQSCVTNKITVI